VVQFSMDRDNAKLLIFRPDLKTNCLFVLFQIQTEATVV